MIVVVKCYIKIINIYEWFVKKARNFSVCTLVMFIKKKIKTACLY